MSDLKNLNEHEKPNLESLNTEETNHESNSEPISSDKINPESILKHINDIENNFEEGQNEITGEQLLNLDIKEIPCLVEPFLQKFGLASFSGSSDTGKSTILRQLAIDIVLNRETFLGFKINSKHQSVIYVSTEDGVYETAFLLKKQANELDANKLAGLRFIFDYENLLEELQSRLRAKKADLIVIDCFSDCLGGDLKDTHRIRTFLNPFQKLAHEHECLIIFLHHTGKRTENLEPNKNNILGGQGFEAKMRLVIELRADQFDHFKRHFCIVKGNYLPAKFKNESYVLDFDETHHCFTNSGNRVPFEMLSRNPDEDKQKAKYKQIQNLLNQNFTYQQIADKMGIGSKGSITKLIKKAEKSGWDSENSPDSDGNEMETKE